MSDLKKRTNTESGEEAKKYSVTNYAGMSEDELISAIRTKINHIRTAKNGKKNQS